MAVKTLVKLHDRRLGLRPINNAALPPQGRHGILDASHDELLLVNVGFGSILGGRLATLHVAKKSAK